MDTTRFRVLQEQVEVLTGARGRPQDAALRRGDVSRIDELLADLRRRATALSGDLTALEAGLATLEQAFAALTDGIGATGQALLAAVDPAAGRATLELGPAATREVGPAAGQVAAGDHGHAIADVTGLQAALDATAAGDHTHPIGDVTGLQAALDGKSDSGHGHAVADVTGLQPALDGKAAASHGHAIADVTGLQIALDGKAATAHGHAIVDVTGLQAALDAKAAASHGHALADVAGLQAALDAKAATAALAPVAFTGAYADLTGAPGMRNRLLNGGCQSSRRGPLALTAGWQPGPVDLFAARLLDGVAGTLVRQPTTSLTRTGWFLLAQGVTAGAGGELALRQRLEASDAADLADGPCVLTARVWHDLAGPASVTVTLRAAGATDAFATTTPLASVALSIPANTETDLIAPIADAGACGTGLEVEIALACPGASGAWIGLGDLQLIPGTAAFPFTVTPTAREAALVDRYLRRLSTATAKANSTSNAQLTLAHPGMRAAPSYSPTGPLTLTDGVTADWTQGQAHLGTVHDRDGDGGRVDAGFFSGLAAGTTLHLLTSGGAILASAEL